VQASGEDYSVEPEESRRPFRALLDVGLLRTTTGNRVFGALKVDLIFLCILAICM
jgi:large subunit ribosomal protein L5e